MSADKRCFFNADRPCDMTCKAAFEVDDPIDNVEDHGKQRHAHQHAVVGLPENG